MSDYFQKTEDWDFQCSIFIRYQARSSLKQTKLFANKKRDKNVKVGAK